VHLRNGDVESHDEVNTGAENSLRCTLVRSEIAFPFLKALSSTYIQLYALAICAFYAY